MRQGKLSALIHNSEHHPSLDYCEVQVHFEDIVDNVRSYVTAADQSLIHAISPHFRSLWSFLGKLGRITPVSTI